MMKLPVVLLGAICLAVVVLGALSPVEQRFLSLPQASLARSHLYNITSYEHVAGTPGDYKSALYVLETLRSFGLSASLQPFKALVSYPVSSSVSILDAQGNTQFKAKLSEDILDFDHTSDSILRNHSFHGYAPSGSVTAEYVYVNYGRVEDFEYLTKNLSLDLTGKIALARYGGIFRGLKVRHAQENGMAAVIIFSDPLDDGFVKGKVYPDGPWRPAFGIQRGSVQFNSVCAGDPGLVERNPDICGYPKEDLIPKIPSLPMAYEDAKNLLAAISGTPSPSSWKGGLDVEYNIGPSNVKLELNVKNDFKEQTLWNVVGRIEGVKFPQEVVLLGNHRDAWVYGASDPNSGTAALLEMARSFSELLKGGWKPARTIVLLSWDGEEYGLLGSTYYGEKHSAALEEKAVAYINVDVAVRGPELYASMTPSLYDLFVDVTKNVNDPKTNKPLFEVWDKQAGRLGSGSDYTVFLDRLGIASVDFGFGGFDGTYHSVYDSFDWMDNYADPGFLYHRTATQIWGVLAIRLTDSLVLPFRYDTYTQHLQNYSAEVAAQYANSGLDLSPLIAATDSLRTIGEQFEFRRELAQAFARVSPKDKLRKLNSQIYSAERQFLLPEGLPGRKWFRHCIQAPGLTLGYGSQVFPGLQDTLSDNNLAAAEKHLHSILSALENFGEFLQTPVEVELAQES